VCVVGVGRVSCVASSRVVSLGVVEAFTVVSVQWGGTKYYCVDTIDT
jgi:hypothetical protein